MTRKREEGDVHKNRDISCLLSFRSFLRGLSLGFVMTPSPKDDWALEMAARCWCDPAVEDRVMDAEMCKVFALALRQARNRGLEEAAKASEELDYNVHPGCGRFIGKKIRALREVLK